MSRTVEYVGNEGNPNKVGDFNKSVGMGSAILQGGQSVRGAVATHVLVLTKKASAVLSAFSVAGAATGEMLPVVGTPAVGQVAVNEDGDILFAVADAVTEAEVVYVPAEGDAYSDGGVVDSGAVTFSGSRRARVITSATVGGAARTVIARAGTPGVGEVCISLDGLSASFNAADNGGDAVINYIEFPVADAVLTKALSSVNY